MLDGEGKTARQRRLVVRSSPFILFSFSLKTKLYLYDIVCLLLPRLNGDSATEDYLLPLCLCLTQMCSGDLAVFILKHDCEGLTEMNIRVCKVLSIDGHKPISCETSSVNIISRIF